MDMIDELLNGKDATDILLMAYFGNDTMCSVDTHGEKHYCPFNPNSDYFRFDGYGNLESSNWKDYTDYIGKDCIMQMLLNRDEIDTINGNDELSELFDKLGNAVK